MGSLLGKFIQGCCMKFDCGSLLQKLAQMQLCPDSLLTIQPKAMDSSKQQSTSLYDCSQSSLSGLMWVLIL